MRKFFEMDKKATTIQTVSVVLYFVSIFIIAFGIGYVLADLTH